MLQQLKGTPSIRYFPSTLLLKRLDGRNKTERFRDRVYRFGATTFEREHRPSNVMLRNLLFHGPSLNYLKTPSCYSHSLTFTEKCVVRILLLDLKCFIRCLS